MHFGRADWIDGDAALVERAEYARSEPCEMDFQFFVLSITSSRLSYSSVAVTTQRRYLHLGEDSQIANIAEVKNTR